MHTLCPTKYICVRECVANVKKHVGNGSIQPNSLIDVVT